MKRKRQQDLSSEESSKMELTEQQQLSEEEQYFADYGTIETHELMLKDTVRTETYLKAIQSNLSDFEDKVILDVGCGTGVLSMFAVMYGKAKKVYAVEASSMSLIAQQLVDKNNMSDRIQVIHGLVESVELPEKVDVIISEWMGFYLVHESMLDSVLVARDKWLKEDGIMYPSKANIFVSPCNMDSVFREKVEYWGNVHGLDFSPIAPLATEKLMSKPYIDLIKAEQLLSDPVLIKEIDIKTVTVEELHCIFAQPTFPINKDGIMQGFCIWFDVRFEGKDETVILDTAPGLPGTHWKQTILLLPEHFEINTGLEIPATICISVDSDNHRHYTLSVEIGHGSQEEDLDGEEEMGQECDQSSNCSCMKCIIVRALTEKYASEEYQQQSVATAGDE